MRWGFGFTLALLLVGATACSGDSGSTAASQNPPTSGTASPSESSTPSPTPALASPVFTKSCTEKKAVDLTGDDPFVVVVKDFQFTPSCFIVSVAASVSIENKDDVGHTWKIDGTLVNAPLVSHQTYTHGPSTGFLDTGVAYPFHCTIHPQMSGTMIVV
jgi:plastocyanin